MKNDYRTAQNAVQQSLQFHTGKTQRQRFSSLFMPLKAAWGISVKNDYRTAQNAVQQLSLFMP